MFFLDYHGWLPKALMKVSPFHGSMIVTSMGSLGIPAIYHHLYNFGTCSLFVAMGKTKVVPYIRDYENGFIIELGDEYTKYEIVEKELI